MRRSSKKKREFSRDNYMFYISVTLVTLIAAINVFAEMVNH
jgi:hypothetical protein